MIVCAPIRTDPGAERCVIGALLLSALNLDADCAATVFDKLTAGDFADPVNRALFAAGKRLYTRGLPLEYALWLRELNGDLPRNDAAAELLRCGESVATTATASVYVDAVLYAKCQRRALCAVVDARNALTSARHPKQVTDAIAQLRTTLDTIDDGTQHAAATQIVPREPFPVDALPAAMRNYVTAASAAIGCDASFIALPLTACLARAIGNRRVIRLKRTWTEPAVIWGAIVGKSGTQKTPAMQSATRFLARRQADADAIFREARLLYEQDRALYDRDYIEWRRSRKSGPTEPPPWPPAEPSSVCVITTDITIEALADRLSNQQDGVLVVRDELAGWIGGIGEYKRGNGSDTGHWLATWSATPLRVDRKTGEHKTINVPRAAVSIVGGVQPGILQRALGQEHLQDGLCARLLLVMPEPRAVRWTDAIVDPPVEAALEEVFARLFAIEPGADEHGKPTPFPLPLSPAAKELWIAYFNEHRAELSALDDDLAAAWAKLEAYTARLALVMQLADCADADAVGESAMKSGIELSCWFGGEAERVYGVLAETQTDRERRELIDLIARRGGSIAPRELARAARRFRDFNSAEFALADLARRGIGRWELSTGPGRPSRRLVLFGASTSTKLNGAAETTTFVDVGANGRPPQ